MNRKFKDLVGYVGLFVVGAVVIAGCVAAAPSAADDESGDLDGVLVQKYQDPRFGGKTCLVFTHDTMGGASIAVVCG